MTSPGASGAYGVLTGRHVLAMVLAFFGVVLAVNGYFLYSALATHGGMVADEPYVKGLRYNERISEEARQNALGWQIGVAPLEPGKPLSISLRNRAGATLTGVEVEAMLSRPATNRHDRLLSFRPDGEGNWAADLAALPAGSWLLSLQVMRRGQLGATEKFRLRRRLWLKP